MAARIERSVSLDGRPMWDIALAGRVLRFFWRGRMAPRRRYGFRAYGLVAFGFGPFGFMYWPPRKDADD